MKYSLAIIFLTVTVSAVVSMGVPAGAGSSVSEHTHHGFSLGAGYERYSAEWTSKDHTAIRDVLQNRIFLQVNHWFAPRLRVGARLGAADLSAPALDDFYFLNHVDYGFSPFGSITLNWTPFGASPGTRGGAIEVLFEVSAFATYTADKIEGSYDGWGEIVEYEAWPEVSSMWEGRLAVLLATHNGPSRFGAGLMLLQSGAETRTHIKTQWGEGTETDYFKTQNNIGMLGAWRFSPGAAIVVNAEVVWTAPTVQFEVSLSRILTR